MPLGDVPGVLGAAFPEDGGLVVVVQDASGIDQVGVEAVAVADGGAGSGIYIAIPSLEASIYSFPVVAC